MARTRVQWKRVAAFSLAVVAGAGAVGGAARAGSSEAPGSGAGRVYVVRAGDTVWSIAVRVVGPSADPRPLVDAIMQRNDLTGYVQPGARLVIPA
jgi:LysM repeat protein